MQTEVKMQLSAFYFQGPNRDFKKGRGEVVGKYLYKNAGNLLACIPYLWILRGSQKNSPT